MQQIEKQRQMLEELAQQHAEQVAAMKEHQRAAEKANEDLKNVKDELAKTTAKMEEYSRRKRKTWF